MERYCLECKKEIKGRADKKFCDDSCRSFYNNRRNGNSSALIKRINLALRKNRNILASHNPEGKSRVSQKQLMKEGFNFDLFTSTYTNKEGKTYYFCYEQGYLPIENEMYFLVVKKDK